MESTINDRLQKMREALASLEAANSASSSEELTKSISQLKATIKSTELEIAAAQSNSHLSSANDQIKTREEQVRAIFLEKNKIENHIKLMKGTRLTFSNRINERTSALEKTPSPVKMRVWSLVVLGIVFFHILCFFFAFSSESGDDVAMAFLLPLINLPIYMVMVGLLAKACKRSAALTWFNLLTLGFYGAIFALVMFIKSFVINPGAIQNEIANLNKNIISLDFDIEQYNMQLIHIDTEIRYLTGRN